MNPSLKEHRLRPRTARSRRRARAAHGTCIAGQKKGADFILDAARVTTRTFSFFETATGMRRTFTRFHDYFYIGKTILIRDRLKRANALRPFFAFSEAGRARQSHLVRARVGEKARSQPFVARACHVPRLERTSRRYHRGSSKHLLEKALDDRGINPGCAFSPRISPRDVPRWLPRPPVR